jgi:hypothetical protein
MRRPPFFSRIAVRLLAFNLLLVFLPVAGFLYLDTYERQLLRSLEHALAQQARVLAASLSGRGLLAATAAEAPLRALRGGTRPASGSWTGRPPAGRLQPPGTEPAAPYQPRHRAIRTPVPRRREPPCTAWPPSPSAWPAACSRRRSRPTSPRVLLRRGTLLGEELRAAWPAAAATRIPPEASAPSPCTARCP